VKYLKPRETLWGPCQFENYPGRLVTLKGKGKVVPVLNYAPRHEDVLESGGIAPRILYLATRWR
jgi:hypothetical protein